MTESVLPEGNEVVLVGSEVHGASSALPAISIEHARKAYGRTAIGRAEAVADVSLQVMPGTIHGLLGPNGAGKTTTLKMLLGFVKPSGGTFEILGRPADAAGARSRLGFLPEQPYFPVHLTVREALGLYGRLAGLPQGVIQEQTPALLESVGLDGHEKSQISRFSRGMLQRLGLAQALLGDPSVVVLDEPASGLDPVGQRDVRSIMLDLRAKGIAVLLSSHQLSEVEAVCDEVTILNRGHVAARGDIDDLLNVAGQTSIRAQGEGVLPDAVKAVAAEIVFSGKICMFSVADSSVRHVVDVLDESGWRILSLQPKRDSLEDYFTRLTSTAGEAVSHE